MAAVRTPSRSTGSRLFGCYASDKAVVNRNALFSKEMYEFKDENAGRVQDEQVRVQRTRYVSSDARCVSSGRIH